MIVTIIYIRMKIEQQLPKTTACFNAIYNLFREIFCYMKNYVLENFHQTTMATSRSLYF